MLSSCARTVCRTDADCDQGPNGVCRAYFRRCNAFGFYCSYDDDVCRSNQECMGREPMLCRPNDDGHGTRCVVDLPAP